MHTYCSSYSRVDGIRKRRTSRLRTPAKAGILDKPERDGAMSTVLEPAPTIVVALDIGTTYSGFAYALVSAMEDVHCFYDWPDQGPAGVKPYCKTETSLRYISGSMQGEYHLQDWGWTASCKYKTAVQNARSSGKNQDNHLVKMFKLLLAPIPSTDTLSTSQLPLEWTAERTISDYLYSVSSFVMNSLQKNYGPCATKKHVQWCLTVPAMWDDFAKQQMLRCAEKAGMVKGPLCQDELASPHPIIIVLEPEAAAVYCLSKFKDSYISKGSKFLIVDAGGGTVDLVVHEKLESSGIKVKEVACSTGRLCGGTFIDKGFHAFVAEKIGCYERFQKEFPATTMKIQEYIEGVKCGYYGETEFVDVCVDLPAKLAVAWEEHDKANGSWHEDGEYDMLLIPAEDVKRICDVVVDEILEMIRDQFRLIPEMEAIMVVGGFSNSPYLMKRITGEFSSSVKHILNPPDPGCAVCKGAVAFGAIDPDLMLSRKSRKTYGISMARSYRLGDPTATEFLTCQNGQLYCKNVFSIFVRQGDDVPVESEVKHIYDIPRGLETAELDLYATVDREPKFVTDSGVEKVGSWTYHLPRQAHKMLELPSIEIRMYFGRTKIDMKVVALNFKSKDTFMSVNFERDFN